MISYIKRLKAIKEKTGKGVLSQIYEILVLRFFYCKIGPSEYYFFQLYDDARFTFEQKTEFVGWRMSKVIDDKLNDDRWRVFANDKVVFASMMQANNLACTKIDVLYDRNRRFLRNCILLDSIESVGEYLRNPDIYPVFIKPVNGTYGRGGFSAISYESGSDSILMGNKESRSIDEILNQFEEPWVRGYIIQKLLAPHPEVELLIGSRLSSLRIIVLLTGKGPQVFRAVWKIPTGNNMSDNFMHGQLGNLVANIDIDSGRINKAVSAVDWAYKEVDNHPDTGQCLTGQYVPLWEEVKTLCSKGARLFPGLQLQHWDVALCSEGPVALEVNVEGGLESHQLTGFRGINDKVMQGLTRQRTT